MQFQMSEGLKRSIGNVPQWINAALTGLVGFLLIFVFKEMKENIRENSKAATEAIRRISMLEEQYRLTDAERRQAIKELRDAHQQMLAELKILNTNLIIATSKLNSNNP